MTRRNVQAFWVSNKDGNVKYEPAEHAEKVHSFLLIEDEGGLTLIAGEMNGFITGEEKNTHNALYMCFIKHGGKASCDKIVGAGNCLRGMVGRWISTGFDKETPEELKPLILEVLGCIDSKANSRAIS